MFVIASGPSHWSKTSWVAGPAESRPVGHMIRAPAAARTRCAKRRPPATNREAKRKSAETRKRFLRRSCRRRNRVGLARACGRATHLWRFQQRPQARLVAGWTRRVASEDDRSLSFIGMLERAATLHLVTSKIDGLASAEGVEDRARPWRGLHAKSNGGLSERAVHVRHGPRAFLGVSLRTWTRWPFRQSGHVRGSWGPSVFWQVSLCSDAAAGAVTGRHL
jgi:hypothetical protein